MDDIEPSLEKGTPRKGSEGDDDIEECGGEDDDDEDDDEEEDKDSDE